MTLKRSTALSTYVAALVLIVTTMSLSFVVYQGVRSFVPEKQDQEVAFVNRVITLQTQPGELLRITVNASEPVTPAALEVQGETSKDGVLYVDSTGRYGTLASSLCLSGAKAFFSVYSNSSGSIQVQSNGQSWIDGHFASSLPVQSGWNEVIITDASSCSVLTPDGATLSGPGPDVSGFPMTGSLPANHLIIFVPSDGSTDPSQILLLFTNGELDQVV